MSADEEAAYVREVAEQKTAALRMSLDAVERQGMPFLGETGGAGFGGGTHAADPDVGGVPDEPPARGGETPARGTDRPPDRTGLPMDPALAERLAEARRQADAHLGHDVPRAPRPEKMQR